MKKKILIVFTGEMELGGIERSLLGLLDAIDYDHYEVDLFLYGHHGVLFPLLNPNVNLLPEVKELAYLRESFGAKVKHGCFYAAALRLGDAILSHFKPINHDLTWAKIVRRCVPKLTKHYDMALGFFLPFDYLMEKVEADLKIGWIHTDYSVEKTDLAHLFHNYSCMDKIAAVSTKCKDTFSTLFPQLADRVIVIENILTKSFLMQQANLPFHDVLFHRTSSEEFLLLSIGRYCTAKNFDNVPDICRRLIQSGCKVRWYLIGFGGDEALICRKISEAGMAGKVILLGRKENPYPYLKACDLYVQPSRYEGKCVAVREAQTLCKPVVITDYLTAASQLEDGVDGVIVPMDNEGCAQGIAALLQDQVRMKQLSENCRQRDYTNADEVQKLYQFMA